MYPTWATPVQRHCRSRLACRCAPGARMGSVIAYIAAVFVASPPIATLPMVDDHRQRFLAACGTGPLQLGVSVLPVVCMAAGP